MNNNFSPPGVPTLAATAHGTTEVDFHRDPIPYRAMTMETEESLLRRYWRIVLKRRLVIAGVVLACVLAAIAMAMFTQRMYRASVTVEIAREAAQVIEKGQAERRAGADPEFYQTQYELLRSRSLAEAVVRNLRLGQNEAFLTGFGARSVDELPTTRADREAMAIGLVMGGTAVIPVRMSGIVNIAYESPDPATAAAVANSLAENAIEANLGRRFEATAYARNFLEGRLAQLRERLEASERQAVAYAGQNQIINITSGSDGSGRTIEQPLVATTLSSANQALSQARTTRIAAENRFRESGGRAQPNESLQNSTVNALRQQRAQLNGEYQRLISDFGPEYPQVRAMQAQLAEIDRQLSTEANRVRETVSGGLAAEYREALRNEQQHAARVDQLTQQLLDQRRRGIQYTILQREVDTNRSLYDALLQRYREIGIAGGVGTNNISIVDRAMPPGAPFKPNLRLNILLGLLIGMVLGAGLALVLEQLDELAISPDDFQRKLGLPLLGTIPVADRETPPAELLNDPKSSVSEAYLSVLTGLHFSTAQGTPRSLIVTSTQPGEGKSTTGLALARSLARLGRKVLLIDADMRNPSVHKTLGLENQKGLSSVLVGDGTIEQLATSTAFPGLSVLTSGPLPPNPAELLAQGSLRQIIQAAGEQFDHIVVDAPPVLGLADAPLLARTVDATVFILESKRTRTSQARQALGRLFAVRAPMVGAVLTKFDNREAGYGYGYGYDYAYGK